ncbi:MAG: metallophosphoesterase [Bacteroidota bacterium]
MRRIAHLSDIHFGKIAHPGIVDAIVEDVNREPFDLVAVSGDLTQRARPHEYTAARAMLDRFEAPMLVVPGNHDVRAWWHHPVHRVFRPALRFQSFITDDLTPSVAMDGLAVFGLNSAHGLTIKGGLIRPGHLGAMVDFFASQPTEAFRVLVLHHHLLRLDALGRHDVARGARAALAAVEDSGVDLVLCGHLHRSHVAEIRLGSTPDAASVHRLVIASAGTATSSRGRAENAAANLYNWIEVGPERFTVEERRFVPERNVFEPDRTTAFRRT